MAKSCSLARTLHKNLPMNRARINFISKFILALVSAKTVNLVEIASLFGGKASQYSHYRTIRRFFANFKFCYVSIARFVLLLLGEEGPYYITIDRTNWKFGKANINIFTLGIALKGVAFPLFWTLLDKRGNSNTDERITLIKLYLQTFGKDSILYLLADREFRGKEWIQFLMDEGIHFRIRIPCNIKTFTYFVIRALLKSKYVFLINRDLKEAMISNLESFQNRFTFSEIWKAEIELLKKLP